MSSVEYFVRNIFVAAFMFLLWTLPMSFWVHPSFIVNISISLMGVATLFLGEVLWGEIVYKYTVGRLYNVKFMG